MYVFSLSNSCMIPATLSTVCCLLTLNIFSLRRSNLDLKSDIERGRSDLRLVMDRNQDCNKELDTQRAGLGARNLEAELTKIKGEVNSLTGQRDGLQRELEQLQTSINAAGAG